jgi:putative ABC transport system substrate-binding protein
VRLALAATLALLLSAAQAQVAAKRVGVLFLASPATTEAHVELLRGRLRELGWVEGRTLRFDHRSADGRAERLPELAAQLVAAKVDLIVTGGGNVSTLAAREATATIPIVMTGSVGAVEAGLVASLARPGGNITGLTVPRQLGEKQLELLRELVPTLSRLAILTRSSISAPEQRAQNRAFLQFFNIALEYFDVDTPEGLSGALARLRASRADAMIVGPDPLLLNERDAVVAFARSARIPAMYPARDFVDAGGLVSYTLSREEVARAVARYIDAILRGARPATMAVEQPGRFELVLNAGAAKALGLQIPQTVLQRADALVE